MQPEFNAIIKDYNQVKGYLDTKNSEELKKLNTLFKEHLDTLRFEESDKKILLQIQRQVCKRLTPEYKQWRSKLRKVYQNRWKLKKDVFQAKSKPTKNELYVGFLVGVFVPAIAAVLAINSDKFQSDVYSIFKWIFFLLGLLGSTYFLVLVLKMIRQKSYGFECCCSGWNETQQKWCSWCCCQIGHCFLCRYYCRLCFRSYQQPCQKSIEYLQYQNYLKQLCQSLKQPEIRTSTNQIPNGPLNDLIRQ